MSKDTSPQNLYRDLGYAIFGINCTERLFDFCPPRPGMKVLEPGCGVAKMSLHYSLFGCHCIALDVNPESVDYAFTLKRAIEELLKIRLSITIYERDLFQLSYPENYFDLCFNEGVPQHFTDEERRQGCINIMARVARKVAIIGNNGLNPREQEIDRTFQFSYKGMPPKRKCFMPEELAGRMRLAGLKNIGVVPVDHDDFRQATLIIGYGEKP